MEIDVSPTQRIHDREAWVGIGLGVALVAVLVLVVGTRLDDPPDPVAGTAPGAISASGGQPHYLADLREGPVSEVPVWRRGVLHVGTTTIQTPLRDLRYAGGTTLVGRAHVAKGSEWFVVDGERLRPLTSSEGLLDPVLSADGSVVAWSERVRDDLRRLVALDPTTRTELGRRAVPVRVVCCDQGGEVIVHGVDDRGRVFFSDGRTTSRWVPGGGVVEVDGLGNPPYDELWPGGVMFQGRGATIFSIPGIYGTVDRRGHFHRVGRVQTDQQGTWSPDGAAYAYPATADGTWVKVGNDSVWVERASDGERVRLRLPTERDFQIVAWESPTMLILQTRNDFGVAPPAGERLGLVALVRCDATTDACERAGTGPTGRVVLPPQR